VQPACFVGGATPCQGHRCQTSWPPHHTLLRHSTRHCRTPPLHQAVPIESAFTRLSRLLPRPGASRRRCLAPHSAVTVDFCQLTDDFAWPISDASAQPARVLRYACLAGHGVLLVSAGKTYSHSIESLLLRCSPSPGLYRR